MNVKQRALRPVIASITVISIVSSAHAQTSSAGDAEGHGLHGLERIVFSSLRPGNWDIFYFSSAGAEPRRLTDHPGLDYNPAISPDGRWVVFTSERRGSPDLYALNLHEEGEPQLLIDSVAMEDQAAFSPDGETLVFVGTHGGTADIYVIPFRPTTVQRIEDAENLTDDPSGNFRPAFSPDGSRIAFSSDRDTPAYGHPYFPFTRQREGELYVMERDGANARRLTDSPDWDGSPAWSHDGETIYFYSARPRELPNPPTSPILGQEGGFRIWAMDADGSNPRPITSEGMEALAPAVTPDGRIAFQTREGYAEWKIVSVDLESGELRQETDGARNYWHPSYHAGTGAMVAHGVGPAATETPAVEAILGAGALLSADYPSRAELPDRALALYPMRHTTGLAPHPFRNETAVTIENEAGTRLVLADFEGHTKREFFEVEGIGILSGSGKRIFDIKWSEDGEWITYTQGVFAGQQENEADIWLMRADGSERVNLTAAPEVNDGVAAFSPDGQKLVFRSSRGGSFDLYLMDRDGGTVMRLTDHPARDNFPVFSPSGDAIAFTSDREGEPDRFGHRTFDNYILALGADGTPGPIRRVSHHPGHDAHPAFSPDGQWIVYTSEQGGISDEEPLVQEVVFGPQMYGEIFAYRLSDGHTVRLTHNKWEEGNPFWVRPAIDETALLSGRSAPAREQSDADEPRPDFSGIWEPEVWSAEVWPLDPPFTEAGRAAQEAWAAAPEEDPSHRCIVPLGRIVTAPLPHEVIQQPQRLTLLYEYDHQVRRVFMDGRSHPAGTYPTLMGHSIGWWEGETLVVETSNLEPGLLRPQGLPYTGDLRLIERLTLLDGGSRKRIEMLIDDPAYYVETWGVTKHYRRTDEDIKDYECIIRDHLSAP